MILEGYAALFGAPDLTGDIVAAGAFVSSLMRRPGLLPMYVEHEPRLLAGYWRDAYEDRRGLFVRGALDERAPGAARAQRMIGRGVDGLSIGFITLSSRAAPQRGRVLDEVDLLEVSIVSIPMQPRARLTLARAQPRALT